MLTLIGAAPSQAMLTILIVVLAPLGFVALWSGVCVLLALLSGWAGLARRYRCAADEPLGAEHLVTGMLGVVSFRGALTVGVAEDGLDLRVMALFRPGHPPLRIPWDAIQVEGEARRWFLGPVTRLRLGPGGPLLRIPSEIWARAGRPAPAAPR